MHPPQSPSDERNGEPYYIESVCSHCGVDLELHDNSGWNDEWACECDGVRMDWPDSEFEKLTERCNGDEYLSGEQVRRRLKD